MKYLSQINALMSWQFNNGILSDGEYRLYMTLLHCMNKQRWEERAAIPNGTVKFLSNINNDTKLKRYRDGLISKGLIRYENKSYVIPKLYNDENVSEADTKAWSDPTEKRAETVSKSVSNSVSLLLDKDKDKDKDKDRSNGASAHGNKTIEAVLETVENDRVTASLKRFIEHRKSMRKPLTSYALERSIELLEKLGGGDADTMCKIIEQSILRNWQSFYELKDDNRNVSQNVSQNDTYMSSTDGISEIERQFMNAYSVT